MFPMSLKFPLKTGFWPAGAGSGPKKIRKDASLSSHRFRYSNAADKK
jgi:hypothetical protein